MRSDGSQDARYLFFNVSPDGGHHHPDTLSIQIWAGGRPLLIDPGTGHYYTGEREFYRRSWWHNCPTLGPALLPEGLDPKVLGWETGRDLDYAVGQVTVNGGTIRRHVFFVDRQYWVLWDDFEGMTPGAQIWENFHFPTEEVRISEAGRVVQTLLPEGTNLLMCAGQGGWEVASEAAKQWLSYGGEGVPTRLLHYRADGETAARGFAALFVPFEGAPEGTGFAGIERFQDGRVRMDVMVRGRRFQVTTSSFS
jgi:hypothetical protein